MSKVGILSRDNKWGLTRDVKLLTRLLTERGHTVTFINHDANPPIAPQDVIIFNELLNGRYWSKCRHKVLIPNQEWFLPDWLNSKRRFTSVWCKTQLARDIFAHHGFRQVRYMGFTTPSIDQKVPFENKEVAFVHVAGNSRFKGTNSIIKAWQQNPEWPLLYLFNVYQDLRISLPNVKYFYGYQDQAFLNGIRNRALFHIQPSEAEGFGHVIWEAFSCGAILITTNAPPMNDLAPTAYLVSHNGKTTKHGLGTRYFITPETVRETVTRVLQVPISTLKSKSQEGRNRFTQNKTQFINHFNALVKEYM